MRVHNEDDHRLALPYSMLLASCKASRAKVDYCGLAGLTGQSTVQKVPFLLCKLVWNLKGSYKTFRVSLRDPS